ncbi:hypothetical protein CEW87_10630 [Parazoarcus communis]|uniref:Polymerase nucleotidyl transferase domain-containing protein n=1 Tax=Parazoarcus communis TaxID=41977 RepID=A0A2U8H2J0_9RHOO|nr:nucleotidyltransferase domain-containing protein [Parazoarcus communis]AWI79783.1 hypothetical protein CEW87_10630 [Parazoarcus communis]
MRISSLETRVILQTAHQQFGTGASVWLFGSRIDDARRGGDLDLMIVVDHPLEHKSAMAARFAAELQWQLGDQKIDVVIDDGNGYMPIHQAARQTGKRLQC